MKKNIQLLTGLLILILLVVLFVGSAEKLSLTGGCNQENSTFLEQSAIQLHRISYCRGGDANIGEIRSEKFIAKEGIVFWYSGYPGRKGMGVSIVPQVGDPLFIQLADAGERWVLHKLIFPERFKGIEVALVAVDSSSDAFGWVGVSSPVDASNWIAANIASGMGKSLYFGAIFYILLVSVLAIFLRRHDAEIAVPLFFVAIGLVAYLAFFLYYWKVIIGIGFSVACLVMATICFLKLLIENNLFAIRQALVLIFPSFVLAIFVIWIGYFPFDAVGADAWGTAANRFLPLPIDNWISKIFADQVWLGKVQNPMVGDWQSSDRGPLQTGFALLFYPLSSGDTLLYQVIASMLQTLVLLPTWTLLRFLIIKNKAELIFVLGMSSLVVVHSLFVWPKLISAVYVLLVFLAILLVEKSVLTSVAQKIFIIGGGAALAMLSHGGAVFPLVVLGFMYGYLVFRQSNHSNELFSVVACCLFFFVVMCPWLVYGKYIDPSHGRLFKWHFAGLIQPSKTSILHSLQLAYSNITLQEWLLGKIADLDVIFSGYIPMDVWDNSNGFRKKSFFSFNYSMWFFAFNFAIPVWLFSGRPSLPSGIGSLIKVSAWSIALWVFAMYEPGATVIHQGSFMPWILIFLVGGVVWSESSTFVFKLALAGNSFLLWIFYVPIAYSASHFEKVIYYTFAFLLFGLFFVAVRYMDYEFKISSIKNSCKYINRKPVL